MQGMYNTFYDINKMSIWGEPREGGKSPRLTYSFRDGNPRFVVHTGIDMPNKQGEMKPVVISFPCSLTVFYTVMEAIERVADGAPGYKESINSLAPRYNEQGVKTNEKRVVSVFHVGKTKDGIVTIMIKEDKKPEIPFGFKKNEWHTHTHDNQEEFKEDELSRMYAKAYCFLIKNSLSLALMQYTEDSFQHGDYKPSVIQPYQPNGFKGKSNAKNAYGSKGAKETVKEFNGGFDDLDDDIPF